MAQGGSTAGPDERIARLCHDLRQYLAAGLNIAEMSDVPREKMDLYEKLYSHPVHSEQRVKHTRWVVLRWPLPSMAQAANTSTEAFEDF